MLVSSLVVVVVGERMVGGSAVVFRSLVITSIIINMASKIVVITSIIIILLLIIIMASKIVVITSIVKANWIVETSSDKLSLSTFVSTFTFTRESYEGKRIELFNLDPSFLTRHTFWSQVKIIATLLLSLAS